MILRKPYAFFIKHFRLIHLILSFLMLFCLYYSKRLLDFFNSNIIDNINLKGQELMSIYTPGLYQVLPLLIIIVLSIILVVMGSKKKPVMLYIVNIALFIYTMIIVQAAKNTLGTMEMSMIDSRAMRLVRDLVMISFVIQIVGTIIILIRSIGFDVKKFDFKHDLKELEISEQDREEFEVELNIDKNKTKRNIRRKIRFLKYAYKENKLLIQIIIVVSFILISSFIGYAYLKMDRPVNENTYITNNGITLKINKSYITDKDYKGNSLDKESVYIVLQVDIKSNAPKTDTLDIATAKLSVGEYSYIPTYDYKEAFIDFGSLYLGGKISKEYETKVLVYQIPKQLVNEKIEFHFVNKTTIDKKKVKLQLKDLRDNIKTEKINIGQTLEFKDSIIKTYKIKINDFDIKRKYKLNYNFCYNKECFESYEYLVPTLNSNIDKSILMINGELSKENEIPRLNDLADIIQLFGTITYSKNGALKTNKIELKEIVSTKKKEKNIFYIEVPAELESADSISINFKIRNKNYIYVLK